jgi:hypothetical protein
MYASPVSKGSWLRPRRGAGIGLVAALCALVVGLLAPAGACAAGVRPHTVALPSVTPLPSGEVEDVLAEVPLADLSATQLGDVLSKLPALSILPTSKSQKALTETIEHLAAEGVTLGELGGSTELIPGLEAHLKGLLSLSELLGLLKGQSLTTVLNDALGSLNPSQILGGLGSTSTSPQLIEEALAGTSPTKLESLLGSTLTGEPFSKTTVGELASALGMTTEQVAGDLNTTITQLPSTATAMTAPLTDGKTLGVLDALEGLHLGLITNNEKSGEDGGTSGGSGGSGGAGGSGGGTGNPGSGSGGSGGSGDGSSGAPAGTTVVIDSPAPQGAGVTSSGAKASAKIKLLSKRVRGETVTLVLQVPSAGRLTLTGRGVRSVIEQTDGSEVVALQTVLRKASAASIHKHHGRHLDVELDASFKGVGGQGSSITTRVAFG